MSNSDCVSEGEGPTVPYDYLVITTGSQYIIETTRNGRVPDVGVVSVNGNYGDLEKLEKAKTLTANGGKKIGHVHVHVSTCTCTCTIHVHVHCTCEINQIMVIFYHYR